MTYTASGNPVVQTRGTSKQIRDEFTTIATEMALLAPKASPTFTGTVVLPAATSIGNVSATELAYLDGLTSAIQTQIDAIIAGTLTGTGTGTLTDVSGSRSLATTYTNSGGTVRWVFVVGISSGAGLLTVTGRVNSQYVAYSDVTATGASSHRTSVAFPVPPGVTYIVNIGTGTVSEWREMQ